MNKNGSHEGSDRVVVMFFFSAGLGVAMD